MTQEELILLYLQTNQWIIPAKMGGYIFNGNMFGSETSRACRRLRKRGTLHSDRHGKFERFYMAKQPKYAMMKVEGDDKFVKVLIN